MFNIAGSIIFNFRVTAEWCGFGLYVQGGPNISVFKATTENQTTSVTTHFKNASFSSKSNTLETCRMRQLL